MGFDGIVSQSIMFIAVLGASAMLVAAFNGQLSTTTNAMNGQQDQLKYQISTDVNIEVAAYNSSSQILSFYARNTGTTSIRLDKLSIYVGTTWITNNSRNITVQADTAVGTTNTYTWDPNEVIASNISINLNSGTSYTLRIITQYQTDSKLDFIA